MQTQVIYANGRFRVMPYVTHLMIEVEGRVLQTFEPQEIEAAVAEVDRMAEGDGCFAHATA